MEDEDFSSPSAAFRMPNRLMFDAWLLVVLFVFALVEGGGSTARPSFFFFFSLWWCCCWLSFVFLRVCDVSCSQRKELRNENREEKIQDGMVLEGGEDSWLVGWLMARMPSVNEKEEEGAEGT